jgi:crotonobetaine/carnitine-CoA ligase
LRNGSAVAEVPNNPLLIWDERQISYREFDDHANRAANVWHDLGVRRGDHVAFMVDNKPEFLYAWFGLAKLGATLVAVNTGFTEQETRYLLEHSQAKYVLVDDVYDEIVAPSVAELPGLRAAYGMQPGGAFPYFGELVEQAGTVAPVADVHPDDVISFIYTSGTSGKPKAVMQSQKNLVLTGQAYPHWMRMERGDRIYACLPLFHINSQAYSMMGAIGARGSIVLAPRFSAGKFWDDIRRHEVAVFNFIGAMTLILSKKKPADDDLDNDVKVAYGVPALPGELRGELERRYGLTVISGFGMSETTFGLLEPYDDRRRPGAMGFPRQHPDPDVPRTEAAVVDGEGTRWATTKSANWYSAGRRTCSDTSMTPRRPPRRFATAGSSPGTWPAATPTGSTTSSTARRTSSAVAARTCRRSKSRTSSTTIPRCSRVRGSGCRPN